MKKVNIVVSCYNEEKCIKLFVGECKKHLSKKYAYEIIFVNDGSIDNTRKELYDLKKKNKKVDKNIDIKAINFSRNFGHESAMLAGLDYSDGDFVVFMDADLQHPIEKVNDMIKTMEDGHDIVSMVRTKNDDKSAVGELLSKIFYRVINGICHTTFSENASDFFGIDRYVCDFLQENYREKVRFLRGIVQNIGFKKTTIEYEAKKRAYGKSRYNIGSLIKLAKNTLYSYTDLPLVIGKFMGILSILCGVVVLIYTLITRKSAPSGYATIVILICFMFAILFFILGVMGEYISMILKEVKDRPNYIIEDII